MLLHCLRSRQSKNERSQRAVYFLHLATMTARELHRFCIQKRHSLIASIRRASQLHRFDFLDTSNDFSLHSVFLRFEFTNIIAATILPAGSKSAIGSPTIRVAPRDT